MADHWITLCWQVIAWKHDQLVTVRQANCLLPTGGN